MRTDAPRRAMEDRADLDVALERAKSPLDVCQAFVAPDDADGHNLLGYSLRHLGRHAESLAAYERALALNPAHLGAHEYLGELFLQTGQRARALRQLQILAELCQAQCEEYQELKQAIEERTE